MSIRMRKKSKVKRKALKYFIIVLIAFCISLMFHVEMNDDMDFARHQIVLNNIRNSGISFWDCVANNQRLRSVNKTFSFTYSYNLLCYIVAKLFKKNYMLVWISSLIEYGVIAYIAYDWKKDSKYTLFQVISSILFCFAVYPMIHAFSGIRTSVAASLMALAVYFYLYKGCSIVIFSVLCFISITFHPVMLMAVPIVIAVRVSSKRLIIVLAGIATLPINYIATLFAQSNISFLNAIAAKYFTYTAENQFRAWRFCFYGVILICLICILYYILDYKAIKRETYSNCGKEKLYAFLICYMCFIMGNIRGYEMVMRPSYLLGALAPIIISLLTEPVMIKSTITVVRLGVLWSVILLSFYMGIKYIYYVGSYFI